jgi:hypothetical protein
VLVKTLSSSFSWDFSLGDSWDFSLGGSWDFSLGDSWDFSTCEIGWKKIQSQASKSHLWMCYASVKRKKIVCEKEKKANEDANNDRH